jgi:TolB-like protein/Tfp pilus assembly protein PilF
MPSLIPGFEYDIFISYRQKDNGSTSSTSGEGWVTEFVANLKKELGSTFKEDISIYFDQNPHDGLLETHDVDDSLSGKLKSVILIPILSQTYCDPKSFAWKHEFVAFLNETRQDHLGLKVRLPGGNVSSRVLPITIHELDADDQSMVEKELGGPIRGIEFIYRSKGVVRPLRAMENDANANLSHTFYQDQINKVARAIKEIIGGIKNPAVTSQRTEPYQVPEPTSRMRRKLAFTAGSLLAVALVFFGFYFFSGWSHASAEVDRSIALIPFENMNHDPEQDYFSNGIAEDILNHLTKVSDLNVKSRTSTLQYKGTEKTIPQIGKELGVRNIVEGSVRRVGNQVRIVVQLIDAQTDNHLWSETYDMDLENVLEVQSKIAIRIATALNAQLTTVEKKSIERLSSQNMTAYDYYLKARDTYSNFNGKRIEIEHALSLINEALKLDPQFSEAYALKGRLWYEMSTFGLSQKVWQDSAIDLANKSIEQDAGSASGYILRGDVERYVGDLSASSHDYKIAYDVSPNDPVAIGNYGSLILLEGDPKGAELILKRIDHQYSSKDASHYLALNRIYYFVGDNKMREDLLMQSKKISPQSIVPYLSLSSLYLETGRYDDALHELDEAQKINPDVTSAIDERAWCYYYKGDLQRAVKYWSTYKEIEAKFDDSTQTVPFRNRLGMVYAQQGKKKEADALIQEDLRIQKGLLSGTRSQGSWEGFGSIYYGLAVDYAYLKKDKMAIQYLDSAFDKNFYYPLGYDKDPVLQGLKQYPEFNKVTKRIEDRMDFLKSSFLRAINLSKTNKELKGLLK